MSSIETSPLSQTSVYVYRYDPSLLYPLARQPGRGELGLTADKLPFQGIDIWNAYEISWLNLKGKPLVRLATFCVPASSCYLIESKSFKLYLNSFNLTPFADEKTVKTLMQHDLSEAVAASVDVKFFPVDAGLPVSALQGVCLDDLDVCIKDYTPAPRLLQVNKSLQVKETLVSHLLKSNCPVTGQPDWASVQISYQGWQINHNGLLAYLISYREKGGFHEQCVESIFMDLLDSCQPQVLSVYARYLRRGGLDINPWRSTLNIKPENQRQARQ